MKFPERLKKLRKEKNLYQKELAEILGVSRPTISQYEAGTRRPDNETLEKLADYFKVSIDYLLGRTDERSPVDKIKSAISDDQELMSFWDELSKRDDLRILLKQSKDLDPKHIRELLRHIKMIQEEEDERYN